MGASERAKAVRNSYSCHHWVTAQNQEYEQERGHSREIQIARLRWGNHSQQQQSGNRQDFQDAPRI